MCPSPYTTDHIARKLKIHQKTVSRHLIRTKSSWLTGKEDRDEDTPQRNEHEAPVDMNHPEVKELRKFNEEGVRDCSTGNRHKSANNVTCSQFIHVAINDHSR